MSREARTRLASFNNFLAHIPFSFIIYVSRYSALRFSVSIRNEKGDGRANLRQPQWPVYSLTHKYEFSLVFMPLPTSLPAELSNPLADAGAFREDGADGS